MDGNGNIIDPTSDITNGSRQVFSRGFLNARVLRLRMRYSTKGELGPIVKLFGRTRLPDGTVGAWQILKNRLFESSVLLRPDESDIEVPFDEPGFATTADPLEQTFELQGCNEFLVGVEREAEQYQAALDAMFA